MAESHTKRFYDRISNAYDLIADGGEHVARERGLEKLALREGESVLEIGFGTGHSLVDLARRAGGDGKVVGIDISSGMEQVASKRLSKAGLSDRVDLLVDQVPPIPQKDATFDAVVMSFTLELFPLEIIPGVLKECLRVLRPDGRLMVVSMASVEADQHESVLEKTYIWMHKHFPHIVDCQPIPLELLLHENGFSIQASERMDLFSMPVAIAVSKKAE